MSLTTVLRPRLAENLSHTVSVPTATLSLTGLSPQISTTGETVQEEVVGFGWSSVPLIIKQVDIPAPHNVTISASKLRLSARPPRIKLTEHRRYRLTPTTLRYSEKEPGVSLAFSPSRAQEEMELTELLAGIL